MDKAIFGMEEVRVNRSGGGDSGEPEKTTIEGYAAVFGRNSSELGGWFVENIQKGAFEETLKNSNVVALWNHNTDLVLGSERSRALRLEEDDKGLRFELELPDTQAGRDAATLVNRGDVDGMSFGFRVLGQIWDESDPDMIVRTLTKIELHEISPTAFPAYPDTTVDTRSARDEFEAYKKSQIDDEDEELRSKIAIKLKLLDL